MVRARIEGEVVDIDAGEVILSAGAVHSPAILMRSGIGPADHLRAMGVSMTLDLPVGEQLPGASGGGLRVWKLPGRGRVGAEWPPRQRHHALGQRGGRGPSRTTWRP